MPTMRTFKGKSLALVLTHTVSPSTTCVTTPDKVRRVAADA